MRIAVVGSGPAGFAALLALSGNCEDSITVIDTGLTLSDVADDLGELSGYTGPKETFLGNLPFQKFVSAPHLKQIGTNIPRSFARGGLSLVWGATMLPFLDQDCDVWPIKPSDLREQYSQISHEISVSGETRTSNTPYPDFGPVQYIPSSKKFARAIELGEKLDFSIFPSRVAIKVSEGNQGGCILCKKCLSGCEFSYIWSSKMAIESKFTKLEFNNIRGFVHSYKESDNRVNIHIVDEFNNPIITEPFDKVYLAAGAIESFRISSESLRTPNHTKLIDSSIRYILFFAPFFSHENSKLGHSLTQAAMRLTSRERNGARHIQFYNFEDPLVDEVRDKFSLLRLLPKSILNYLLSFFAVGIYYLPGSESPDIQLKLNSDGSLATSLGSKGTSHFLSFLGDLVRNAKAFVSTGLIPFPFYLQQPAGSGVHFGSWAPMGISTDHLGRLTGVANVHIVDSSILPTIPAGPITFTVMANCLRIVQESRK